MKFILFLALVAVKFGLIWAVAVLAVFVVGFFFACFLEANRFKWGRRLEIPLGGPLPPDGGNLVLIREALAHQNTPEQRAA